MTTTTAGAAAPIVHEKAVRRDVKVPIFLDVFAVLLLVLAFAAGRSGTSTFDLHADTDFFTIAPVALPTYATTAITAVLLAVLAVAAHLYVARSRDGRVPRWLSIVFAVLFLIGFLTWAAAGQQLAISSEQGLLVGTLGLATPLIFGAMGGVIGERVGIVNIAIESQLLLGAFSAAVVSSTTHSPWAGLVAAMIGAVLLSFLLAAFSITYFVDQVIIGVVLNVLVIGLTNFFYSKLLAGQPDVFNAPVRFDTVPIPGLSSIPIIGPLLFQHTIIVYVLYVVVFLVWFGLFRTKWGLRLRAVGEHPTAADTVGINVTRTRFWNTALAGAIVGIGGAYYTLDSASHFNKEMTNGAGYIALAAVIFGQWHPIKAMLASLLFGFALNLNYAFQSIGSPVPSEFMLMLPYVVTIVAVAGLVGHSRAPAASGKPYIKS